MTNLKRAPKMTLGKMNKLYFKYGAMGSSKTAQALMCRYNYITKGFEVFLFKPKADTRCVIDGVPMVSTRIGLTSECIEFSKTDNFLDICKKYDITKPNDVIIVDEAQFLTKEQVDELKEVSQNMPVLCYGLLTNFKIELFEGSKRLVEIADALQEIKSVCKCGRKATVNARLIDGKIVTEGEEIVIGAEESYESMCYNCFKKRLSEQK